MDETMQFLLFFPKICNGHNFNHSGFPSAILTKGVKGFHSVRFPHFIPMSRANQSTGSGSVAEAGVNYEAKLSSRKDSRALE